MRSSNKQSFEERAKAPSMSSGVMLAVTVLLGIVLVATTLLTMSNNRQLQNILEESVKGELAATSFAARDIISRNIELFEDINSQADIQAHQREWDAVVRQLCDLRDETGAQYIYALKEQDGGYWFVFDTDEQAAAEHNIFTEYELSEVHELAFRGIAAEDIMNVQDEWGSYNTGAVPLYDENGKLVGIVSTDFADAYIERSLITANTNTAVLIAVLVCTMCVLVVILVLMLHRNNQMQRRLFAIGHYDSITKLPNRQYLFRYLAEKNEHLQRAGSPFAVAFIDIDNFKAVNDSAGHDTGDELLVAVASFLRGFRNGEGTEAGAKSLTARIGGDEFLQVVPEVGSAAEASSYASSMIAAFNADEKLGRFAAEFNTSLSIGISLFPADSSDYDELIHFSDIAMYHAKRSGKGNFKIYQSSMGADIEGAELSTRRASGNTSAT